jgi:D-apiose dehydrogenase
LDGGLNVETKTLRGAMIGTGSIAPYHLTAWSRIPGVEIVALANRTVSKALDVAGRFGLDRDHVYGDIYALLEREADLDFVDIALAPDLHRPATEAAARRGVHVICQKPLAPSLEDAEAMIAACRQAGVLLSVNENWRWRAWYRQVKQVLDEGRLGRLRYARIAQHRNVTLGPPDGSPPGLLTGQAYTGTMARLIVYEWGIHLLDTLRMLLGEAEWVHAHMTKVSPLFAGEDRALMTLGFGAVVASVDISWASHAPEELPTMLEEVLIEGDQGSLALVPNQGEGDLLRLSYPLPRERVPENRARPWSTVMTTASAVHDGDVAGAYQASYDAAQAHFIECLRAGTLPETHAGDNLCTLGLTFAAYQSAAENRVVAVELARD